MEGHHAPIIDKSDWLLAQQIRKERRYVKRPIKRRKLRYVIKGPLAGFMITDPKWDTVDVVAIWAQLLEKQTHTSEPMLLEDENFMIEKE